MLSLIIRTITGLITLLFGRLVFWLNMALVGFLAGFFIGGALFPDSGWLIQLLIGLALGIVGALLSRIAPIIAAGIVGFFAGGFALTALVKSLLSTGNAINWIVFLIGGALAVFLVVKLFDLALVILSSIVGAATLAGIGGEVLSFPAWLQAIVLLALAVVGIWFQLQFVKPQEEAAKR